MNKQESIYNNIHQDIIDRCKSGEQKAQFQLYKLYYKAMFNTCLRIVNDSLEAEDIMQEAFLKAFDKISFYKGEVSFGAWLKKIVVNHSLDELRKRKLETKSIEDSVYDIKDEENIDNTTELILKVEEVKNEISKLPDGYRIVISLYLIEGYDHDEISEILNISSSTSRSQFARAKKETFGKLKRKPNRENKLNMKDLDNIIKENKHDFDSFEPNEGHFGRFEQRLIEYNNKQKSFSFGYILKAAIVAILVTLSGLWVFDNIDSRPNKGIALSELSPEYNEVEMYYTQLVNQKYGEITQSESLDSSQKTILVQEMQEMDAMYENLKKDLMTNPSDKRVINAMIKHYQLKVEIMNQILDQLRQAQEINNQKSKNYESTNI